MYLLGGKSRLSRYTDPVLNLEVVLQRKENGQSCIHPLIKDKPSQESRFSVQNKLFIIVFSCFW